MIDSARRRLGLLVVLVATLAVAAPAGAATRSFPYTGGNQSWTVPAGVTQATFDLYGAQGSTDCPDTGKGARVRGTIAVTPGETLRVRVGGQGGFNGGGTAGAGGGAGGGASDIRRGSGFTLADRLLVAGGGGAKATDASSNCLSSVGGASGAAGDDGAGAAQATGGLGGRPGTANAGGDGGQGGVGDPNPDANGDQGGGGDLGQGGGGALFGGGGGGGYYGGGGGGSGGQDLNDADSGHGGGGGGGSSFTGGATGATVADGARAGNGLVVVTYTAPPSGGGGGGGGGGTGAVVDLIDPGLGSLALSPQAFRAARRGGSIVRRGGTRVAFSLSERAKVRFTVSRARSGRRVGRRCVKPTRSNRSRRRCTRYVSVRGSFTFNGVAGENRFRFSGRLRGRRLRPGRYRLTGVPTDAAGNKGNAKRKTFRIRRP